MVCNPDVALRGANGYGTPDWEWRQPVSFVPATQKVHIEEVKKEEVCLCKS